MICTSHDILISFSSPFEDTKLQGIFGTPQLRLLERHLVVVILVLVEVLVVVILVVVVVVVVVEVLLVLVVERVVVMVVVLVLFVVVSVIVLRRVEAWGRLLVDGPPRSHRDPDFWGQFGFQLSIELHTCMTIRSYFLQ